MLSHIGKYEIQAELGRGGFGAVYKAFDPAVQRPVAIKILAQGSDPDMLVRFRQEAIASGRLRHRNIVNLYDFGEEQGAPYIVMELLEGKSLQQLIQSGLLTLLEKVSVIAQVTEALAYAHGQGVVHGDVKPANIFVLPDGTVKLLDFGIARLLASGDTRLTQTGAMIGTPRYMAPEQFQLGQRDARSEIFVCGVVFYELLAGRHPFYGESAPDIAGLMYRILSTEPAPVRSFAAEIPESLELVIKRMLAKDPEFRYQSLQEVAFDVQPILLDLQQGRTAGLLEEARRLLDKTEFAQAEIRLKEVLQLDPRNGDARQLMEATRRRATVEALKSRSEKLLAARDFAYALQFLKSNATAYPDEPALKELMLRIETEQAALKKEQQRAGAQSRSEQLEKGLQGIRELLTQSKFPEAAATLAELRREFPDDARAASLASQIADRQKQHQLDQQLQAIHQLLHNKQFGEALAALEALHRDYPENADVVQLLEQSLREWVAAAPSENLLTARQKSGEPGEPFWTGIFRRVLGAKGNDPSTNLPAEGPNVNPANTADVTRLFVRSPGSGGGEPEVALLIAQCPDLSLIGRIVLLHHFPFSVGSAGDLAIASDSQLTTDHVKIRHDSGGYQIETSTREVFVDGKRVPGSAKRQLRFGATIRLTPLTQAVFMASGSWDLPDLTGILLDGRFRLIKQLHRSARAAVYAAQDEKLPRSVAVKVLSPRLADYPNYLEEFQREAALAARLNHRNICRLLDHGETLVSLDGQKTLRVVYVSMELMEGGSLQDRISSASPIPVEQIAVLIDSLALALDYAHKKGVIHSGIKPTTIVFDGDGNPFLTDFAIAAKAGDGGSLGVVGAAAYLAPEQWSGCAPTEATDQYALAAITYFLVTGSRPYVGQDDPDVRERNFANGPVAAHVEAARSGRTGVPPAVSAVLARGMAVKPEDRYATVGEFASAFRFAISAQAAPTPPRIKPHAFFCYHRESSAGWAVHFAGELRRRYGITVFVDTENQDSAAQFPVRLRQEIERCDVFVCFLADASLSASWVDQEIQTAFGCRKPMIPIFQETFKLSDVRNPPAHVEALLNHQGIPLLDRRAVFIAHTISDLAKMIKHTFRLAAKRDSAAR